MGKILDELLSETVSSDSDEQLRIICDKITEEEMTEKERNVYSGPTGPNIFLSLAVLENDKQIHYICLEREAASIFIISHWIKKISASSSISTTAMRMKVWNIMEDKPEKLMKEYALKFKWAKGE